MKNDSLVRRRYTPVEISGWIRRYRAGSQSLGEFAAEQGLPRNQLHYWVYGRHPAPMSKSVGGAPVFQELKVTAGQPTPNWEVEIGLPSGTVVRFTAAATPAWITSVVEALRQPC